MIARGKKKKKYFIALKIPFLIFFSTSNAEDNSLALLSFYFNSEGNSYQNLLTAKA